MPVWLAPREDVQARFIEHLRTDGATQQGAELLQTPLEELKTVIRLRLDSIGKKPAPPSRQVAAQMAFSPDSKILVIGSGDGTIKLWDMASLRELLTLRDGSFPIKHAVFSPHGKKLVTVNYYNSLRVWHAPAGGVETAGGGEGP